MAHAVNAGVSRAHNEGPEASMALGGAENQQPNSSSGAQQSKVSHLFPMSGQLAGSLSDVIDHSPQPALGSSREGDVSTAQVDSL